MEEEAVIEKGKEMENAVRKAAASSVSTPPADTTIDDNDPVDEISQDNDANTGMEHSEDSDVEVTSEEQLQNVGTSEPTPSEKQITQSNGGKEDEGALENTHQNGRASSELNTVQKSAGNSNTSTPDEETWDKQKLQETTVEQAHEEGEKANEAPSNISRDSEETDKKQVTGKKAKEEELEPPKTAETNYSTLTLPSLEEGRAQTPAKGQPKNSTDLSPDPSARSEQNAHKILPDTRNKAAPPKISSRKTRPKLNKNSDSKASLKTIQEVIAEDHRVESKPEPSITSVVGDEEANVDASHEVEERSIEKIDKEKKKRILRKYKAKRSDSQVREQANELLARIETVSIGDAHNVTRGDGSSDGFQQQSNKGDEQDSIISVPRVIRTTDSFLFKWVFPITLIFLLIIIAASLAIVVLDRFQERDEDWNNEISPVEGLQRLDNIQTYLVAHRVSDSLILSHPTNTPGSKAVQWLAWEDAARIDIPSINATSAEAYPFVTRYIMAVLYYAMDGPNWRLQFDFLSPKDVCEWRGALRSENRDLDGLGVHCDDDGTVVEINLNGNDLRGEIPVELTRLTTLRVLQMSSNVDIHGQLPAELSKLSQLEHVAFSRNHLTGSIPSQICGLSTLRQIFLGFNEITGTIPRCIDNLANLESLFLSNNLLSGFLPQSIATMRNLQLIWLDDNVLQGDITTTFNRLPLLRALFLEDNDFEGTLGDRFLRRSKRLLQLDVSGNRLQGSLPSHFFVQDEFRQLEVIDLHGNRLSGNLPDLLVPNDVLQFIALYDNAFTGTLPRSWGTHLSGVFHLDLSRNSLGGDLPSSIGSMDSLRYLFMGSNDWKPGPIPSSWSNLLRLEELSMKGSQRTGPIPDFLAKFSPLVFLDLDDNEFQGAIPSSLGNLVNLEFLLLNRNRLIGALPPQFSRLRKLRVAFLEGNYLMGDAASLCSLPNFADSDSGEWSLLVTDCQGDNTTMWPIECQCCIRCCSAAPLHHQPESLPSDGSLETVNATTTAQEVNETETEISRSSRPTCHDWTGAANLNPRWEMVYKRESYELGDRAWFDTSNSRKRSL